MKRLSILSAFVLGVLSLAPRAHPHCQIPCGIYGDAMRIDMIEEDITTIEKSMSEINRISKEKDINYNQLVRWIDNKDDHAAKLTEIVTDYFMAQRVKPSGTDDPEYVKKLTILHQIMVEAMKCKQTTDLEHVKNLRDLTARFRDAYLSKEDKEHLMKHHSGMTEDPEKRVDSPK